MKKITAILLAVFCCHLILHAQWQHSGPEGGMVKKIVVLNKVAICVTNGGMYRSIDDGANWVMQPNTVPDEVTTIIIHANKFFVSSPGGIFSSPDGLNWTQVSIAGYPLLYSNGTNILAYFNGKVYVSPNGGQSFGVGTGAYSINAGASVIGIGTVLYVGTASGVWYSNSGGAGWSSMNSGVGSVTDIINITGGMLVAAANGIYKSNGYTGGGGFALNNTGIPVGFKAGKIIKGSGKYFVTVSSINQTHITLYSSANGSSWAPDNGNYPIANYFHSDYIFNASVICNSQGIFKSTDKGNTWVTTHSGIKAHNITDMETGNGTLYAAVSNRSKGGNYGALFSSADAGANWLKLSLPDTLAVEKIVVQNNAVIAFVTEPTKAEYALYKSADAGSTWAKLTGYTNPLTDLNYANNTLFITNSYLNRDIIDRSTDFGATWQQISASGFPFVTYPLEINTTIGTTIFANIRINVNANGGIFKSADNGVTWSPINNGINPGVNIVLLTAVDNTLFAAYNGIFNTFSILYRSTNMGATWTEVTGPAQSYHIVDVQGSGGSIFASTSTIQYGVDSGYVFQSKDNGDTWTNISANLPFVGMGKIKILNGNTFLAPPNYSIWANSVALPVTFLSIGANRTNAGIVVDWKVTGETNIRHYEVERSADGSYFKKIGTVNAGALPAIKQNYTWLDSEELTGTVYYRIKSVGLNGDSKFTGIVKMGSHDKEKGFAISPNPVKNAVFNLQFKNQQDGKYAISVIASNGTTMYTNSIVHDGSNSTRSFYLPESLAAGTYIVKIISPGKVVKTLSLLLTTK